MAIQLCSVDEAIFEWLQHQSVRPISCRGLFLPPEGLEEPAILRWLYGAAHHFTEATGHPGLFMIIASEQIVGLCSYKGAPMEGHVEIGYGILPPHRNKGFATEAVGILLAAAIPLLSIIVLTAKTKSDNIASQRVLTHHGFIQIDKNNVLHEDPLLFWEREIRPRHAV